MQEIKAQKLWPVPPYILFIFSLAWFLSALLQPDCSGWGFQHLS